MSVIAPGASYTSRLLMPTARFSIMSIRPIPYGARESVGLGDEVGQGELARRRATRGSPLESDHELDRVGASHRDRTSARTAPSGGAFPRILETPASIARPKRFSSIENGEAAVCTTGMPLGDAYSISSSRVQIGRASGAITVTPGIVRLERELEAQLVVPLAGAPVNDRLAPRSSASSATAAR
jgi:hypothetical protein